MFDCKNCQRLEARVDKLLADAHEERKLQRESADKERAEWGKERAELLTRIQAWNPKADETPSDVAPSRGTHEAETVDGVHTQDELNLLGLIFDPEDKVYYDVRLNPPAPYETVEDCRAVRKLLVKKGLPETAHPGLVFDEGFGATVEAARASEKDETQED